MAQPDLYPTATAREILAATRDVAAARHAVAREASAGLINIRARSYQSSASKAEARGKWIDRAVWRRAIAAGAVDEIWDDDQLVLAADAATGDPMIDIVGFEFDRDAIERIAAAHGAGATPKKPVKSAGGRPTAGWWAAFAEELAVYIHEVGVPEGLGSEGQGEVINSVCDRMSERSVLETPNRRSVQPIVQAVLDRIRAA
jgi:hypothetical protein